MRDARQISSREVSQGVQRHVLGSTTWFGMAAPRYSAFLTTMLISVCRAYT